MTDFSYASYRTIVKTLLATGKVTTFHQVVKAKPEEFIVIRHDIEFSVAKALELARLEKNLGLTTTYLVQLRNPVYNPLAKDNLRVLKQILKLGHVLGLHYYCDKNRPFSPALARREIRQDLGILSQAMERPIDIFSTHRPNQAILKAYLQLPGAINCYGRQFFHFGPGRHPVVYLSDSNCRWPFGQPMAVLKKLKKIKMQILFHPYSWNKTHASYHDNVNRLLLHLRQQIKHQINRELTNVPVKWQQLILKFR